MFEKEASRIIEEKDIKRVQSLLIARLQLESMLYLEHGKDAIFDVFVEISQQFNGTQYMQGKKDGLRIALALLGNAGMAEFNQGGSHARELPETVGGA